VLYHQFCGGGISRRGTHTPWKVNEVTPDGESGAIRFFLLWLVIDADSAIGDVPASIPGNLCVRDEEYCVGAFFSVADALGQAAQFVGKGVRPCILVFGAFDEVVVFHGGAGIGVYYRVGPMVDVVGDAGLKRQIDVDVMVVSEHGGY
jgi:hypothetical protein